MAVRLSQDVVEVIYATSGYARLSQLPIEVVRESDPGYARVSQVVVETIITPRPYARLSQLPFEIVVVPQPYARVSQEIVEILHVTYDVQWEDYSVITYLINASAVVGGVKLLFELVVSSVSGGNVFGRLYDVTGGAPVAGTVAMTSQDGRIRSAPFSLPSGIREYKAQIGFQPGASCLKHDARIVPE